MIELEGTEEIGPRIRQAKRLRRPDDTIRRRTNHSEKGETGNVSRPRRV